MSEQHSKDTDNEVTEVIDGDTVYSLPHETQATLVESPEKLAAGIRRYANEIFDIAAKERGAENAGPWVAVCMAASLIMHNADMLRSRIEQMQAHECFGKDDLDRMIREQHRG